MTNPKDWEAAIDAPLDRTEKDPRFRVEIDAICWVLDGLAAGGKLPVVEAEAVAHSLFVDMRTDDRSPAALLPLHHMREYNAVHAINVAMLAMALAERLEYDEESVRAIGFAGLLHDIGMVKVPVELLAKSEPLGPGERDVIRRHPIEGARMIVEADASLDLAAVVAYEHHIRVDGSGYPNLTYKRTGHRVSRLVQVCDTYHALSSPRPFREPWPTDVIVSFLNQNAGTEFDTEMVGALIAVIKDGRDTP